MLQSLDVLVALHACNTATEDALAKGLAAGARLLVVSPCRQKQLRSPLTGYGVINGALRHETCQKREAEFVTEALRACRWNRPAIKPRYLSLSAPSTPPKT